MEKLLYSDVLKTQSESFINILKNQSESFQKQSEFFQEALKALSESNAEMLRIIETERDYYRSLCLEKPEVTSKPVVIIPEKESVIEEVNVPEVVVGNEYNTAVNEYLVEGNEDLFVKLIENYPDRISETLKLCMNKLPDSVADIAEIYDFVDKFESVKKLKENISILRSEKHIDVSMSYLDLCDAYRQAFKKKQSTLIKRYIRQIYVKYFDKFNEFINRHDMPSNFDSIYAKIKLEFEGKPAVTTVVIRDKNHKPRTDYRNIPVDVLAQQARGHKTNKRQFISRSLAGMRKAGRSVTEMQEFESKSQ